MYWTQQTSAAIPKPPIELTAEDVTYVAARCVVLYSCDPERDLQWLDTAIISQICSPGVFSLLCRVLCVTLREKVWRSAACDVVGEEI